MLVTFTTKAYADITMFGDVTLSMLKNLRRYLRIRMWMSQW